MHESIFSRNEHQAQMDKITYIKVATQFIVQMQVFLMENMCLQRNVIKFSYIYYLQHKHLKESHLLQHVFKAI